MVFTEKLPSNSMAIVAEGSSVYLMGILTQGEADLAKKIASNTSGVKDVYVYFDIISDAEKARLEKQARLNNRSQIVRQKISVIRIIKSC